MARHLVERGFDVHVWARRRSDAVSDLAEQGALVASTLPDLARQCKVVITVLPTLDDVQTIVSQILPHLAPDSLLIDSSTVDPAGWRQIAASASERGIAAVDAPVTGGDVGAIAGTLTAMCGGDARDVKRAERYLACFSSEVVHVGESGAGQVVKAANQVQAAASLLGMAEALVLAAKWGVDPAHVVHVLSHGAARCWAIENRGPRVIERDFAPGFRVALHRKDLGIALRIAEEVGVPMPIAAQAREAYTVLITNGQADDDVSALVNVYERAANGCVEKGSEG